MTSMRVGGIALVVLVAGLTGACKRAAPVATTPAVTPAAAWEKVRDAFIEDRLGSNPPFAVDSGRHEFDGKLPDWSKAGIAANIQRLHEARDAAEKVDAKHLEAALAFERNYTIARIDNQLFWLETAETPFTNPTYYLDGLNPSVYLTRDYAPLADRMRAYVAYAKAVPAAAGLIRENLRLPLPKTFVERAISGFAGYASFFADDVPKIFAAVDDAALQADFKAANKAAADSMRELAKYFEAQRATATDGFALGAGKFSKMLAATEQVTTPLAELAKIGRADLDRNLAAVKEACAKFAPGKSIPACFAKLNADKPKGGPVAAATGQLVELRKFVIDKNVVSVPNEEQALVREAPPYNRANSAYIEIPGPFEKPLPAIYYIAPPDPAWSKADQLAYIPGKDDLLFTSVHEVWPGHFLNFLHANESNSMIGRLFVGYAFAEGWAHYAEEMMWDMGLDSGDAEAHVGQLSNALLRNVRFVSAIGLHTGGMTVEQSERMFRDEAFQDPGNARQQAARGTYDPAYLNYTMGKLMIMKLRADWTATRGGRAAWKQFHDEFLSYGGPPIPMVRRAMLGEDDDGVLF
ncbi:MAG: hypothetical protein CMLOHMNK_01549 [Steroidobacteraceae bacterium]|nr:hypothetical protein [Steroidobacteraceae bacterium]